MYRRVKRQYTLKLAADPEVGLGHLDRHSVRPLPRTFAQSKAWAQNRRRRERIPEVNQHGWRTNYDPIKADRTGSSTHTDGGAERSRLSPADRGAAQQEPARQLTAVQAEAAA